jgi:hypothetical protein
MSNQWTNGSYTLSWENADQVRISGPSGQTCVIDGGDFEYALSALCAAYRKAQIKDHVDLGNALYAEGIKASEEQVHEVLRRLKT